MAFTFNRFDDENNKAILEANRKKDEYETWQKSDELLNLGQKKSDFEATTAPSFDKDIMSEDYKRYWEQIQNREDYSYDFNADALYQQYKDQYINNGRLAMQDAMGQASAMTGGYGNSYAVTVGNQTYQNYLRELNNIIPELEQNAYNRYLQEGQELRNNLDTAYQLYQGQYGEYRDELSDYNAERDRLFNEYYTLYNLERGEYETDRDYWTNLALDTYNREYNEFQNQQNNDFLAYQQGISEYQFNKNYGLSQEQLALQKEQFEADEAYRNEQLKLQKEEAEFQRVLNSEDSDLVSEGNYSIYKPEYYEKWQPMEWEMFFGGAKSSMGLTLATAMFQEMCEKGCIPVMYQHICKQALGLE